MAEVEPIKPPTGLENEIDQNGTRSASADVSNTEETAHEANAPAADVKDNLPPRSAPPATTSAPAPIPAVPDEVIRSLVPAIFGPKVAAHGPRDLLGREKEARGREGFIRVLLDG